MFQQAIRLEDSTKHYFFWLFNLTKRPKFCWNALRRI